MTTLSHDAPSSSGAAVVERLLADLDKLPGRQPVLLRVAQVAEDPDSSNADLADLCAADPAFTSRMLRLANSAFYGQRGTVTALGPAVSLVGRSTLRTAALSMALGLAGEHGALPAGFWEKAALTAVSAQLAARSVGASPGDAICAGLLCDLGQALLHRAAPAAYGDVLASTGGDDVPGAERAWCGTDHAELGAHVLRSSGLPDVVCTAIAEHHLLAPQGGPLAIAVRAGVLIAGQAEDPDALAQLGPLTGGRLEAADGSRLALTAAANAAALSSVLG